jgi:antitoxin component of RelBE/YafQ-DinJ toxin-antitoxin module
MALTVAITAKVPLRLRDEAETVAARRNLTVSTLLRRLLEQAVAEAATGEPLGEVESAAREEIAAYAGTASSETRVAAALNLARRLDQDSTNGAAHARELRALLDEIGGRRLDDATPLDILQARRLLRLAGYTIVDPGGRVTGVDGWRINDGTTQ